MTPTPTERVLDLLHARDANVRRQGRGHTALCPAHDDRKNSLKIDEGNDGRVLLQCYAGCDVDRIVAALGLEMRDLFPDSVPPPRGPRGPGRRIVATYNYVDADGRLLYQAVRFEPKGFSQRRPDGAGGWIWNLGDTPRVLYRLPDLLAADWEVPVFLCEGEKDANRLRALGLVATTNAMGASAWRLEYTNALHGRTVVILPDNDDPGRAHAQKIARSLDGVATGVKVVELPDLPPKGDVSDWLDAGHDPVELLRLVDVTPAWEARNETGQPYSEDCEDSEGPGPWEPPTPLADIPRPEFPTEVLPPTLQAFVEALATATQTPPALPALLCLSVIAAAAAKRVSVRVRDGWTEPVNVFTAVALPPGNRKSTVFAQAIAPLTLFEREEAQRLKPEIARTHGRRKVAEQALARAQAEAAKAPPQEWHRAVEDADRRARELAEMEEIVVPRLVIDDCSPERVATLLAEQGGRIAALSAEGGLFEIMAGRYSGNKAPNFDVFLKGHAGDEIRVDRVSREPVHVPEPAVTVGLAVQPTVIRNLAGKPGFRGLGLLARFWYAMPASTVGRRAIVPPSVPAGVREAYHAAVRAVLEIAPSRGTDGTTIPQLLVLSPGAAASLVAFEAGLEPRLGEMGDLAHVADWAAKLAGSVARLAGILHTVQHAHSKAPWRLPIDRETVDAAARVARDFLIPHALVAFAEMGADPAVEDARYLLRWLEEREVATISRRALHQQVRARFPTVHDLGRALAVLVEHGFIREGAAQDRAGAGRKPSPVLEINPLWCPTQNTHNPQNDPTTTFTSGPDVDFEDSVHF